MIEAAKVAPHPSDDGKVIAFIVASSTTAPLVPVLLEVVLVGLVPVELVPVEPVVEVLLEVEPVVVPLVPVELPALEVELVPVVDVAPLVDDALEVDVELPLVDPCGAAWVAHAVTETRSEIDKSLRMRARIRHIVEPPRAQLRAALLRAR